MKMALEYEDDIVVEDSLSGSSNDNNLVSNGILRLLSGNTLDLNQMKGISTIKKSSKMPPLSTKNRCKSWKHFKFI